jgi:hypothetical protein
MRILELTQGSPEWLEARLGCPSGSGFKRLITSRGEPSSTAETYINELIAEKLTGEPTYVTETEWMTRGKALEVDAKCFYEFEHGVDINDVGFIKDDKYECGVSPDGLIGKDGGIEIKCPKPSTHVQYLRNKKVPSIYIAQIQGCMWITGRKWWDFMSFHPMMEPVIIRVQRDEEFISKLSGLVIEACKTIEKVVKEIEVKQ